MQSDKILMAIIIWLTTLTNNIVMTAKINNTTNIRQSKAACEDSGCGEHPWMDKKTLRSIQSAQIFELNANGLRDFIPYLAQVSYDDGSVVSRCAGTIISATEIITASACLPNDSQTLNYVVRINNTWGSGQVASVKKIIHNHSIINDSRLAVIELEKAVVFSINGESRISVNRVCTKREPCGPYFHLSDEFKPRLVAPTWFHRGEFSATPYIISVVPNCQEGSNWYMEAGAHKLMRGTPLIETNLFKSYLRAVYVGTNLGDNRPTFRAIQSANSTCYCVV